MTPEFTKIYFEKWKEILNDPVDYRHSHNALIKQFAKGLAHANTGALSKSSAALKELEKLIDDKDLALPFGPFNAPRAGAIVARDILKGTIAEKEGRSEQALEHYRNAVVQEDALIYNEPKDWILPARHFLGYALLRMKRFSEAEKVFREDLRYNPKNIKGEKGLAMAVARKASA
jgi:tetratricopeptide (TPR) repeat protein